MDSGEDFTIRDLIVCTVHLILKRRLNHDKLDRHLGRMGEGMSAFKMLIGRPTGKISLGKPRRR